jgi:hypothetical protein
MAVLLDAPLPGLAPPLCEFVGNRCAAPEVHLAGGLSAKRTVRDRPVVLAHMEPDEPTQRGQIVEMMEERPLTENSASTSLLRFSTPEST